MRLTMAIKRMVISALAVMALGTTFVSTAKASVPSTGSHTNIVASDKGSNDNGQETHG